MIRHMLLWPRKFIRVANVLLGILLLLLLVTVSIRWLGPGEIDRIVTKVLAEGNIPGASIAIAKHGQVRYLKAYGWADVERKRPVKIGSLFRIASIAKSLTGAGILKLVEESKLRLDSRVFDILTEYDLHDDADPRLSGITIAHLLQNSGGWDRDLTFDPVFHLAPIAEELRLTSRVSCDHVIRYMVGQELQFEPGTKYAYSNFGYCLLGRVLEQKTGETYEDIVKSFVLAPLGINHMRLARTLERAEEEVKYYDTETKRSRPPIRVPRDYYSFESLAASAGWLASAEELIRFAAAPVPKPVTTEPAFRWDGESYYGYGWRVWPGAAGIDYTTWGVLVGSFAIAVQTHDGYAFVVLFNGRPGEPGMTYRRLYKDLSRVARHVWIWSFDGPPW